MKKIILSLVLVTIAIFALSTNVKAGDTDHAWSTTKESDWGICTPKNNCGSEGTQTQTVTCIHIDGSDVDCDTHNDERRYADKVRHNDELECPDNDTAYTSTDKTKACEREVNVGPDTQVVSRNCTLTDYKACEVDQCGNLSGMQSSVPANMETNSDYVCSCVAGYHAVPVVSDSVTILVVQQDFTCEADSTPTPVPSNPGGPGDGKSDGKSDGLSSCPSCTAPPSGTVLGASTEGQVLGATTDILGATGSNYQLFRMWIAAASAIAIFLLGHTLVRDNETS